MHQKVYSLQTHNTQHTHLKRVLFQLATFQSSQQSQVMWLFISFPSLFFFKFKSGFILPLMLLMHISQFLFLRMTIKKEKKVGKACDEFAVFDIRRFTSDISSILYWLYFFYFLYSFFFYILFFSVFYITLCSNNSPVWEII